MQRIGLIIVTVGLVGCNHHLHVGAGARFGADAPASLHLSASWEFGPSLDRRYVVGVGAGVDADSKADISGELVASGLQMQGPVMLQSRAFVASDGRLGGILGIGGRVWSGGEECSEAAMFEAHRSGSCKRPHGVLGVAFGSDTDGRMQADITIDVFQGGD